MVRWVLLVSRLPDTKPPAFSIFIDVSGVRVPRCARWHRFCVMLPNRAGTRCLGNYMENDLLKKFLTTKSIQGVFATIALALSAPTFAGATIEIDDTRSVSIGVSVRP